MRLTFSPFVTYAQACLLDVFVSKRASTSSDLGGGSRLAAPRFGKQGTLGGVYLLWQKQMPCWKFCITHLRLLVENKSKIMLEISEQC